MISLHALQVVWYVLLSFLLTGFVILDGYDLGAGVLYLFARRGKERDQLLTALAPFWDGNQVWLIAAGGASFAAFPPVYAALLSGLYPLLVLLLLCLILRTVAIEFAHKEQRPGPRQAWDLTFALSSTGAIVFLGLLIGSVLRGLPLNPDHEVVAGFASVLSPWALLVAVLLVVMLAMHGAIWLGLKTQGELRRRTRAWGLYTWVLGLPLTLLVVFVFALWQPRLLANYLQLPGLWSVPALALLAVSVAGAAHAGGRNLLAFIVSSLALLCLFATSAIALYPDLVPALDGPALSLTAVNSSSSQLALEVMLVVVVLGMPLVLAYTGLVHWVFRERVPTEEEEGY